MISNRALLRTIASGGCIVAASFAFSQATYQAIGLTPVGTESFGGAVSADGSAFLAIGWDGTNNSGFRWSPITGFTALPDFAGGTGDSEALALSSDGNVIVGYGNTADGRVAYRWTQATGMVNLGDLAGGAVDSKAEGVSADGSVICGEGSISGQNGGVRAMRWTQATGMQDLGVLPNGQAGGSEATGISGDGTTIVGLSGVSGGYDGFEWTQARGLVDLKDIAGGNIFSEAVGANYDGSVVVGLVSPAGGNEACRWSTLHGLEIIGDFPGGALNSVAIACSADGNWVCGNGNDATGPVAFIWNRALGLLSLKDYLISLGATGLDGIQLGGAFGMSADGMIICGTAMDSMGNIFAYTANLHHPSIRYAEFISQTPPPTTMVAGTTANVVLNYKNIGSDPWIAKTTFGLGSRTPIDNLFWGTKRILMADHTTCAVDSTYPFAHQIRAPWAPGTYNFQWKIVTPTGWFGDFSPLVTVTVTRAVDAATYVSESVPATVVHGANFNATITMKNTGTASWASGGVYRLGSAGPTNNTVWTTKRVELPASSNVLTNQNVTFSGTFTAPTTPGVYTFQWCMVHTGAAYFGDTSPAITINVT